jgi:flagellar biosynthesis/type III secretory pathway protein FliH
MIEHSCDECGLSTDLKCYCEKHLDKIKEIAFNDGKAEGFEEGQNAFKKLHTKFY